MSQNMLIDEFIALRRGLGLRRSGLQQRIGPGVAAWAGIAPQCGDDEVRHLITHAISQLAAADLPPQTRQTVLAALGLDPDLDAATLIQRTQLLAAGRLSERTARRRVDSAFEQLAQAVDRCCGPRDPEHGWAVHRLRALVRLDRPHPEVIEERTIVATRDGLDHIAARLGVPSRLDGGHVDREVHAEIQFGARIVESKRLGTGALWCLLALPRPLAWRETHTYTIAFQVTDGQPIDDHYLFTPLMSCAQFEVRVRFDPAHRPIAVWRTDRAAPGTMPQRGLPDGPLLALDGADEVAASFDKPDYHHTYGVCWRHKFG